MNYIKHLSGFFQKIIYDTDLNPTHVSLYMALFQTWNINRFQNPISITRNEMMRISKIYSKATYHKCINDLHAKEYIIYEPSHNPFKGSLIHVNTLETDLPQPSKKKQRKSKNEPPTEHLSEHPIEQVVNKHKASNLPTPRQALVSYINNKNNTNISNSINESTHEKKMKTENDFEKIETLIAVDKKKKKLREKKESTSNVIPSGVEGRIPPQLEEVKKYFCSQQTDEIEGERFFNHFQSNGWLVGGKSKMYNWQAAANNWILNLQSFKPVQFAFSTPVPGNLKTSNQKQYDEPL
ncbi:transcriptional regulator [Flavobacterium sp. TSSA_36]|uniref:transcriptional regulator n=1 Tax=Flavobacterium sp. TSSA_36 TaxID=3447669 RepID=UPI003F3C1741